MQLTFEQSVNPFVEQAVERDKYFTRLQYPKLEPGVRGPFGECLLSTH